MPSLNTRNGLLTPKVNVMKWKKTKRGYYESDAGYKIAFLNDNCWHVYNPELKQIATSITLKDAKWLAEPDEPMKDEDKEAIKGIVSGLIAKDKEAINVIIADINTEGK